MKKSLAFAAMMLALASAAFCEKLEVPTDDYDDGTVEAQQAAQEKKDKQSKDKVTKIKWNNKANREAAMDGDPYNKKKMIGNRGFGERLLNINKFTKIEPFNAYLKPTVGNLLVRKGNLIYREGTDVAGFEMYYDSSAYALQFAKDARAVAIKAVESYFEDFDEKRLDRNAPAKQTRQAYGFCEGYEDFGVVSGMMTNYSRPKVFFGYTFVKRVPYFTVNVRPAKNLAVNEKTEEGALKANTIEQTYFMTKAQAKRLAVFLSDDNVDALYAASSIGEPTAEELADEAYEDSAAVQSASASAEPAAVQSAAPEPSADNAQ